jgi:four helix bundle protein
MTIRKATDLVVWQKAMDFAVAVYASTQQFPRAELFGLTRQIRNSAASVPCNVAEGHEQLTTSNYIRYLGIARGSLGEVETQIHLATRLHYLNEACCQRLLGQSSEVGRLLYGLIESLRAKS